MHSGMIEFEFPLESVPASVELKVSSLPSFSSLACYRICRWGWLDLKASVLCPCSVLEPSLCILNGQIMYDGSETKSLMVVVSHSYLNEKY